MAPDLTDTDKKTMAMTTVKFAPSSPEEAEDIADILTGLCGATLRIDTPEPWSVVPILQGWSVTNEEVTVTFNPGVIETLGRELTARELLKAAGKSVNH